MWNNATRPSKKASATIISNNLENIQKKDMNNKNNNSIVYECCND